MLSNYCSAFGNIFVRKISEPIFDETLQQRTPPHFSKNYGKDWEISVQKWLSEDILGCVLRKNPGKFLEWQMWRSRLELISAQNQAVVGHLDTQIATENSVFVNGNKVIVFSNQQEVFVIDLGTSRESCHIQNKL